MMRRLIQWWWRWRRRETWRRRCEREHALARAQPELALRQGTDPASLSIRVGPRGNGPHRRERGG